MCEKQIFFDDFLKFYAEKSWNAHMITSWDTILQTNNYKFTSSLVLKKVDNLTGFFIYYFSIRFSPFSKN